MLTTNNGAVKVGISAAAAQESNFIKGLLVYDAEYRATSSAEIPVDGFIGNQQDLEQFAKLLESVAELKKVPAKTFHDFFNRFSAENALQSYSIDQLAALMRTAYQFLALDLIVILVSAVAQKIYKQRANFAVWSAIKDPKEQDAQAPEWYKKMNDVERGAVAERLMHGSPELTRLIEMTKLQHKDSVKTARFNNHGTRIVTASSDATAKVWDITGKVLHTLRHGLLVNSAEFNHDDTRIATASWDKKAILWNAVTGERQQVLPHPKSVTSAQFSHDGKRVVTVAWDGKVRIWDATTGKLIKEWQANNEQLYSATFSADDNFIRTVASYGVIQEWDARDGTLVDTMQKKPHDIKGVSWSKDRTRKITFTPTMTFGSDGRIIGNGDVFVWASFVQEAKKVGVKFSIPYLLRAILQLNSLAQDRVKHDALLRGFIRKIITKGLAQSALRQLH